MLLPPLTLITCPVTKPELGEVKNATTSATSVSVAGRPIGIVVEASLLILPKVWPRRAGFKWDSKSCCYPDTE